MVFRVLSVGRSLRRERRGGDVASGRLAEARLIVLRRGCPWIISRWMVGVMRRVVHGGDCNWDRKRRVRQVSRSTWMLSAAARPSSLASLAQTGKARVIPTPDLCPGSRGETSDSHTSTPISLSLQRIGNVAGLDRLCSSSHSTQCKGPS